MLHQLAYMSTAGRSWSRPELLSLLREARTTNEALGVTGILLYRDALFVQLLEGGRDEVDAVYDAIRVDDRHANVRVIWRADCGVRWFPGWSMAFRDLEEDPVDEPGLRDVLRGPVEASDFSQGVVLQLWELLRPVG